MEMQTLLLLTARALYVFVRIYNSPPRGAIGGGTYVHRTSTLTYVYCTVLVYVYVYTYIHGV